MHQRAFSPKLQRIDIFLFPYSNLQHFSLREPNNQANICACVYICEIQQSGYLIALKYN